MKIGKVLIMKRLVMMS